MTAPDSIPIEPKHFLLRVYSVRRLEPGFDNRDNRGGSDATHPARSMWEVRMETGDDTPVSLFYKETNPSQLPPVDSLLRVTIYNQLTVPPDNAEPPD